MPPLVIDYIRELLEEGHYVMVVTNASLTKRMEALSKLPKNLLTRLFFKFSYHYLELKKRGLLERFFENIRLVRDAGASFTLEATPSDELIPYIDEMKKASLENVGAVCHVTVARNEAAEGNLPILTNMTDENYQKTWNQFNSEFFNYKFSIFNKKRKEFCYAGDWSFVLNVGTGKMRQCYSSYFEQNIIEDPTIPIRFLAVGNNCSQYHCYNGHAFLCLGDIPEHKCPTYATIRNRVCQDGSEWLKPEMKCFMQSRLYESNEEYSEIKKIYVNTEIRIRKVIQKVSHIPAFINRKWIEIKK